MLRPDSHRSLRPIESHRPILVTGATGFIGEIVARKLIENGREVYGTTRTPEGIAKLEAIGVTAVMADLMAPSPALEEAMSDCGSIVHVAGKAQFDPPHDENGDLYEANVGATEGLMNTAIIAGRRPRITFVSSAVTLGEKRGETADEDTEVSREPLSIYEQYKREAEDYALMVAGWYKLDLVRVNPASVQGRGRISGTAKLLIKYLNGEPTRLPDAVISIVDPLDCAEAIVRAEAHGEPGSRYVISGHTVSLVELVKTLDSVTGSSGEFSVVGNTKLSLAIALERLRRGGEDSRYELYRNLRHGARYDGTRASQRLGFSYRPLEETLRDAVEWYAEQPGVITRRLENFPATHHLPA